MSYYFWKCIIILLSSEITDVFAYRSFYKEEKKNAPELTEEELEKVGNTP